MLQFADSVRRRRIDRVLNCFVALRQIGQGGRYSLSNIIVAVIPLL
jgi:hypothetical protein